MEASQNTVWKHLCMTRKPVKPPKGGALTPSKGASGTKGPGSRGVMKASKSSKELAHSKVGLLSEVPAEEVWLASLQSERTRRAYKQDVRDFVETLEIGSSKELYAVTPAAVIQWRRELEEGERKVKPSTIARKLSALSSLFQHLVEQQLTDFNPVRQIKRPRRNRKQGTTAAFSRDEARALLDAPSRKSPTGLRDRAILSVGLQAGLRRSEIAHLTVGDVVHHNGLPCLKFVKKGGEELRIPLNPQTHKRLRDYMEAVGIVEDFEGPLIRPTRGNQHVESEETRRHMEPDMIDRIVRKWAKKKLGIARGVSAHSMRATFITRALEQGCPLERVQKDVGHAHPSTTQLYDNRGDNPEEAATFFATY